LFVRATNIAGGRRASIAQEEILVKFKLIAGACVVAVGVIAAVFVQPTTVRAQAALPQGGALRTPVVLPQAATPQACVCSDPLKIGAAGSIRNCQCGTLQCVVTIPTEAKGGDTHTLQCVR
jgi:hypothetical protein